jgi:EAL domain-containing protein (putative c-di-GMP-specific phosphodiesterase class I)
VQSFADIVSDRISEERVTQNTQAFLENRITSIIAQQRFHTLYQPICNLRTNQVSGFEALTRFDAEPLRPPDQWFAEARAAGMGVELEMASLQLALQSLPAATAEHYLSVNVSPQTLLSDAFLTLMNATSLQRIVLEITEHAIVENYEILSVRTEELRRRGLRLAVDDAGAGFASFKHILALKPDIIKLDMSLVRHIDSDFHRQSLALGLMSFATAIGCDVVAEGVETLAELVTLRSIGVQYVQGYLLGRPAAAEQWPADWRPPLLNAGE